MSVIVCRYHDHISERAVRLQSGESAILTAIYCSLGSGEYNGLPFRHQQFTLGPSNRNSLLSALQIYVGSFSQEQFSLCSNDLPRVLLTGIVFSLYQRFTQNSSNRNRFISITDLRGVLLTGIVFSLSQQFTQSPSNRNYFLSVAMIYLGFF